MCVGECIWKPEAEVGVFINHSPPYCLRQGLSPGTECTNRLYWLALELQESSYLYLPRLELQVVPLHLASYVGVGVGAEDSNLSPNSKHCPN